jgi:hypothetical protein
VAGIGVDKTPPTVTYRGNVGRYGVDQRVEIVCQAADALSGLDSTTCRSVAAPAYAFRLGSNTVSATATDRAGNVGAGSTAFVVTVDPDSLGRLVGQIVVDRGTARSLQSKLGDVGDANPRAKAGKVGAFVHQVLAQRGKKIDPTTADLLISLAAGL